jgi:hypothetical protein
MSHHSVKCQEGDRIFRVTNILVPKGQEDGSGTDFCGNCNPIFVSELLVYSFESLLTRYRRNNSEHQVRRRDTLTEVIGQLTQPTAKPIAGSTQRAAMGVMNNLVMAPI